MKITKNSLAALALLGVAQGVYATDEITEKKDRYGGVTLAAAKPSGALLNMVNKRSQELIEGKSGAVYFNAEGKDGELRAKGWVISNPRTPDPLRSILGAHVFIFACPDGVPSVLAQITGRKSKDGSKGNSWNSVRLKFGGSVEAGEFPADAALREVKEETNLDLTGLSLPMVGQLQRINANALGASDMSTSYACILPKDF